MELAVLMRIGPNPVPAIISHIPASCKYLYNWFDHNQGHLSHSFHRMQFANLNKDIWGYGARVNKVYPVSFGKPVNLLSLVKLVSQFKLVNLVKLINLGKLVSQVKLLHLFVYLLQNFALRELQHSCTVMLLIFPNGITVYKEYQTFFWNFFGITVCVLRKH